MNITIIDDAFLERRVEMFKLTLTSNDDLDERIQFTTDEGEIKITENDGTKLYLFYSKLVLISFFFSHSYSRSGEDNVQCIRS